MISNFSEVEKSLKRCLKEKVSITAATVVGFLIAGTVAFGGEPTNVTFTTKSEGKVTVQVGSGGVNDVNGATNFISVGQYKELLDNTEENNNYNENLAKLLTVETNEETREATFAGVTGSEATLGTVKATATENGALTLIKTDEKYTSITSNLNVEVTGNSVEKTATAMEAANSGDKVTNAGTITVNEHAFGMVAGAGATAVNSVKEDKSAGITVNANTANANTAIGMLAETGATKSTTTLTNDGKIAVTKGIGISVTGDGKAEVTFGENGKIEVVDTEDNIGININGTAKTSNTTITGGTIELKGAGTGINIEGTGNVTLKNTTITLSGAGTGIKYDGGEKEAKAEISTPDIDVKASGATGIDATMSNQATSTLNITTGIISTGNASATGIKIAGSGETIEAPKDGVQKTTATVTTTLGETEGTGVDVIGKAYSGITVNIGDDNGTSTVAETLKTEVSGTGVKITGADNGGVIVKINQKDLKVLESGKLVDVNEDSKGDVTIDANQAVELVEGANLVNIGTAGGNITVNLKADGQTVAKGSLVNVGAITGTTNVDINKDVTFGDTSTHEGNIVKVGSSGLGQDGVLNINLNVTGDTGLNVTAGDTALNLENVNKNDKTFVKNTGTVTIAGTGILVKGNDANTISLSNQGLINVNAIDATTSTNSSHISSGKAVNVANYGTITLNINSGDFLEKYNNDKSQEEKVTDLKDLTIEQVRATLVELGIIESDSEGTFTSLGNIEFAEGAVYTTGEELTGNVEVGGLIATLEKSESRAFKIIGDKNIELTAKNDDVELENVQFNIEKGKLEIKGATPVAITNAKDAHILNIGKEGQLAVADNAILNYSGTISAKNVNTAKAAIAVTDAGTLTLANGALNMVAPESKTALLSEPANRVGIKLTGAGTTNLNNYTVNADIEGTLDSDSLQGTLSAKGKSRITGNVTDIKDIKVTDNGMLTFGADSKIESGATSGTTATTIDLANGNMGVEIGEGGANVLKKSEEKIKFTGTKGVTPNELDKGKVVLLTNALTENTTFNLGTHDGLKDGDIIANGDIYYNITQGNGGIWNATFNKDGLINKTGYKYMELNDMYVATQSIHDLLSADIDLRVAQLDDLYSNNIYSETVKMSLDTLKMNEDAVLSLNVRPKQGEYTAQGKFLFTNTDYDRDGVVRDYKVETKNTGLLGAMEYGLTDTSSVGFAFSGTKQDLDMKNGASADGDAFYFGLYRNDKFNNIDLTTGLGYMIDRVDAKNFTGKDKFDSTAFSGYVQGKYNYAIGENLTLSPKARLTVTRFQQDSINNGRMKQEEVKDTMADVELGVEIKKGIALETGRMNLLAGASFTTNVAGKDDDYYKVSFVSRAGNEGDSTKVKGANLEKNSLKLNIGADVELTNGVFYNGGLSYEFDDEDRDSIGVTLGAGYKF
ncbi:autotransporter domain-containing protein [Fusobacterium varium]